MPIISNLVIPNADLEVDYVDSTWQVTSASIERYRQLLMERVPADKVNDILDFTLQQASTEAPKSFLITDGHVYTTECAVVRWYEPDNAFRICLRLAETHECECYTCRAERVIAEA